MVLPSDPVDDGNRSVALPTHDPGDRHLCRAVSMPDELSLEPLPEVQTVDPGEGLPLRTVGLTHPEALLHEPPKGTILPEKLDGRLARRGSAPEEHTHERSHGRRAADAVDAHPYLRQLRAFRTIHLVLLPQACGYVTSVRSVERLDARAGSRSKSIPQGRRRSSAFDHALSCTGCRTSVSSCCCPSRPGSTDSETSPAMEKPVLGQTRRFPAHRGRAATWRLKISRSVASSAGWVIMTSCGASGIIRRAPP